MNKLIFVLGSCYSGLGKGISTSSICLLMKLRGFKTSCLKLDGYLSSPSLLSPNEHGECFLSDSGGEHDLDTGSYWRIGLVDITDDNICTSGKIYKEILEDHDNGKYLGQTVQLYPHAVMKVMEKIDKLRNVNDILIVEIGGIVSDSENFVYLETIRKCKQDSPNDCMIVMVAPIIFVNTTKEHKTKPLQRGIKDLQSFGVNADLVLCRTETKSLPNKIIKKISDLTGINENYIIHAPDVDSIYQVPIEFYNRNVDDLIIDKFHLKRSICKIHKYRDIVENYFNNNNLPTITIGIIYKYTNYNEAYLSIRESLVHAGMFLGCKINVKWIYAVDLEQAKTKKTFSKYFENVQGIIVPGGFGTSGIEGKIKGIKFARENKIPFFGICLGLQCAVIEIARNVLNMIDSNSIEFNPETTNPVVCFVEGQENLEKMSGTLRLGAFDCELTEGSLARELYKNQMISERHRHRYEINSDYIEDFANIGFVVSGTNPQSELIEIMEMTKNNHPYFVACQFHPEFKSKLTDPSPLFVGLVSSAIEYQKNCTIPKAKE